jgi:hypothetical protein
MPNDHTSAPLENLLASLASGAKNLTNGQGLKTKAFLPFCSVRSYRVQFAIGQKLFRWSKIYSCDWFIEAQQVSSTRNFCSKFTRVRSVL